MSDLEPLADGRGFVTRVRFGKHPKDRRRFRIPITDEGAAEARAVELDDLGRRLRDADAEPAFAVQLLKDAAKASAVELDKLRKLVAELASGRSSRKPKRFSNAAETVAEYAERWFDDRELRGLSSVEKNRGQLTLHVLPIIGRRPIGAVGADDLREVVEHLDAIVRKGTIHWNTAKKVWGLVTKMFSDACEAKTSALRVRSDNPAAGVRGPDSGEKKGKQWLFPTEVAALLGCVETDDQPGVPRRWRQLYALSVYLYPRPGELAALEWKDVHEAQGYVYIHQALDLRSGEVKATKTGYTRKVPIHPSLVPLLAAMRKESGGAGRVVQHDHENKSAEHGFPPLEDLAATLREHLTRAGVTRADLHEERPTTKRVTFYDLRATGITWEVLAATDPLTVKQRAGHKHFSTTEGYIREAEAVGLSVGAPFPPLPSSILGTVLGRRRVPIAAAASKQPLYVASPRGFEGQIDEHGPAQRAETSRKSAPSGTSGHVENEPSQDCPKPSDVYEGLVDPVEQALADALQRAAAAGQWNAVEVLTRELGARREARAGVVRLDLERGRRERKSNS
jgi:integrase